jgi:hypothetical protein
MNWKYLLSRGGQTASQSEGPTTVVDSPRVRRLRQTMLLAGVFLFTATRVLFADPAQNRPATCAVADPQQAAALAEVLYGKEQYQRAGECYQVAGDLSHAQQAFLKAVGPNSEAAGRALKDQGDAAKSLFVKVQRGFRSGH